mmetsp:Transcript_16818/g.36437  ORF Transcript_16818/g.36437 Transcript_16818/m.36437 type:complete len:654 (-) Transcript_16818:297-2258(-)
MRGQSMLVAAVVHTCTAYSPLLRSRVARPHAWLRVPVLTAQMLMSASTFSHPPPPLQRLRTVAWPHRSIVQMRGSGGPSDSDGSPPTDWQPPPGVKEWDGGEPKPDEPSGQERRDSPALEWTPPPGFKVWQEGEEPPEFADEMTPFQLDDVGDAFGDDFVDDDFIDNFDDFERERALVRRRARVAVGRDDTSRLQAVVEMPASFCSGCGARFQSVDDRAPGFVPTSVLDARTRLADDIVGSDGPQKPLRGAICQRCHGLRFQNRLPTETLRVSLDANDTHASLRPSYFRQLLRTLRSRMCVIVCIVDLFDFHGSLVPDLPQIVGNDSPLMLVANKVDLLPAGVQSAAVERWVRSECRRANLPPLHSLDLVSCKSGEGMPQLLSRLEKLMTSRGVDAYVLGAANAGKSSLLNYVIRNTRKPRAGREGRGKGESRAVEEPALTISHLPGTTLDFVKASVIGGRLALYDTPGLILPNQLTTLLTTEELSAVVPKKRSQHVTLKLGVGKSVLLGGLARVSVHSGLPFLFTFYMANSISIHPTATDKVDAVLEKHLGGLLDPPSSIERLGELGEFGEELFSVKGRGWNEAAMDVVLPGLGWVAVTGCGSCEVSVRMPNPIRALTREPLLPSESTKKTMVKFTGSKLKDKRGNTKRRRK